MSWTNPTLAQLINQRQSDINARLVGADSRLRRSALGVLATVFAGGEYGLYAKLDYISDQILPPTQDMEHLTEYASIYDLAPGGATPAVGPATCSGGEPNTDVPSGTLFQSGANIDYVTTADVVLDDTGSATVMIQATTAGSIGLAGPGVVLTLVNPIAGVPEQWTVGAPGLTDGADPETQPQLLTDVEDRIQQPPAGGDEDDYVKWAKAAGVGATRVWVYPLWMGLGTVGVTFMCDNRVNPIPTDADVAQVQSYIEDVCSVVAEIFVFSPIIDVIPLTIQLSPNTATVQAAASAEVAALFAREAAPGGGLLRSHLDEAVEVAAGVDDHTILSPAAGNVVSAPGHLATPGLITWAG